MHKSQRKLALVTESSRFQKYDFVNSIFCFNASKTKREVKWQKDLILRVGLRVRLCEFSFFMLILYNYCLRILVYNQWGECLFNFLFGHFFLFVSVYASTHCVPHYHRGKSRRFFQIRTSLWKCEAPRPYTGVLVWDDFLCIYAQHLNVCP